MDYQKIINSLGNRTNQLPRFRTESWIEMNDVSYGTYDIKEIRFKTVLIKSNVWNYSDISILVKGTTTIVAEEAGVEATAANKSNEQLILKPFALSINCTTEINNIQKSIKSNILMLWCQCTICQNTEIIIWKVYNNIVGMCQTILQQIQNHLNLT